MAEFKADRETTRAVAKIVRGRPVQDGDGVQLRRIIGQPALPNVDPFLMLDEFRSDQAEDYIGGFPDHPHRGFDTVTYMLAGRMRHWDNQGNTGILMPGGAQWMTAGRGVVHSEMPEQQDGLLWGFQLWVNLPAKDKMMPPRYQDIAPEQIPSVSHAKGVGVRVIAGMIDGVAGPVASAATDPTYFDVRLSAGAVFSHRVPEEYTVLIYVYEGEVGVGDAANASPLSSTNLAILDRGERVVVRCGSSLARFLMIAGRPLREPIVQHGPFVMTTVEEVRQAFEDFRTGRL